MSVFLPRSSFHEIRSAHPYGVGPDLQQLLQALDEPTFDYSLQDDFARLGPGLAAAFPFAPPLDPGFLGGDFAISPALLNQVDTTRQRLHTLEPQGQRHTMFEPWQQTQLDEAQAMALMQLLVMFLMMGGGQSGRSTTNGGGGGFQPNAIAPGRFVGVPSQGGRNLGQLNTGSPEAGSPPAGSTTPMTGPSGTANGVTADQLRQIAPNLSASRAAELTPHLNNAMAEAGITTERQQAAFIAQLAHESGGFRYFEELASGSAYEGRRDLGNTQPGDGRRFKGRGPIQLTGRANYRAAGRALGLDLENNPELASRPDVGFRVAAWYWQSRGLNRLAEAGNFREVTRRINGGFNGLADREQYYRRALQFV